MFFSNKVSKTFGMINRFRGNVYFFNWKVTENQCRNSLLQLEVKKKSNLTVLVPLVITFTHQLKPKTKRTSLVNCLSQITTRFRQLSDTSFECWQMGKGDLRKPSIATRLNRQNGTLTEVKSCVYNMVPLTTEHCEGPLATNNAFYAIDCKSPLLVHKTAFVLVPKLPVCCNTIW